MEQKNWWILLLLLIGGVLFFSLAGCSGEEDTATQVGDAAQDATNAAQEASINQDCCGGSCKTPAGFCCGSCCEGLPKYEP